MPSWHYFWGRQALKYWKQSQINLKTFVQNFQYYLSGDVSLVWRGQRKNWTSTSRSGKTVQLDISCTGCFLPVPPNFQNQNEKNKLPPTSATFSWNFQFKKTEIFHFGVKNGKAQLKNRPLSNNITAELGIVLLPFYFRPVKLCRNMKS